MNSKLLDISKVLELYSDMVYKIAFTRTKNTFDADDIFQEVFIRYIKTSTEFDSEEHLKAWLIKVTVNCIKSVVKNKFLRLPINYNDNVVHEIEEKSNVYSKVLKLPSKYRIVIHLFYYEDLSINQISKLLDKKESTIKSQLYRARKILKKTIKEKFS